MLFSAQFGDLRTYQKDPVLYGSVLSEVLQRFWESEEPPTADRRKPEDDECELFYQYNTARCSSGRFVTRLPFLPNRPALGSSRQLAERRLLGMERKMRRDPALRQNTYAARVGRTGKGKIPSSRSSTLCDSDDICTGADSVEQALILRDELIAIMGSGGYELRKWLSSCPELLAGLPGEFHQDPHLFENPDNPNTLGILGCNIGQRMTYSRLAQVCDHLTRDCAHRDTRKLVPSVGCKATLHGFCDASERGYAAAVYLRTASSTGTVHVRLVMAKSKVAPVRTRWTIPKLDLAGAALLARLLNHVTCNLRGTITLDETVYAWTDSRIVLCWLQTSVHTLEVFVANRVSQITGSETPLVWRHVPGEWNPADCASRGCRAPDLVSHPLWWGPQWLTESPQEWPFNECRAPLGPPDRGLRVNVGQLVPKPNPAFLLERYSSSTNFLG
ncbi:pao retrotransposon peptidase domain-containing protein [Phthorimaea operculella]|nr:pao retrotransposon peptidase domain-containing protein [Phthorimaea operculella]